MTDSSLGSLSRWPQGGLDIRALRSMIREAFYPKWWKSKKVIRVNSDGSRTLVAKNDGECEDAATCADNEYSLDAVQFLAVFRARGANV